MEHLDTIVARRAREEDPEHGRFDIIRTGKLYSVVEGSYYHASDLTSKREAYATARRLAREYDKRVREEEARAKAAARPREYAEPREWFCEDERGEPTTTRCATIVRVADQSIAQKVIDAPTTGQDGRSEWLWVRLASGDLIMGCFPQGDTYFATEHDANRI